MAGEWIEWKGGIFPLPYGTEVDVRFRTGNEVYETPVQDHDWSHEPSDPDFDIVAYRLPEVE